MSNETMSPPARLPITIIVAATSNLGIGLKGQLPWHIKADMQYFARVTSRISSSGSSSSNNNGNNNSRRKNAVIMGRKTWDSIPPKFRPLKNRVNVVISRNAPMEAMCTSASTASSGGGGSSDDAWAAGPVWVDSLERAVDVLKAKKRENEQQHDDGAATRIPEIERAFIIGGSQIYDAARDLEDVDSVLLTKVFGEWDVDTYLPVSYEREEQRWRRASFQELKDFTGEQGLSEERQKDGETEFEFRLYKKLS